MACLTSEIAISLRWKIEAASTASAPAFWQTSTQWWVVPAPPEAITGTSTASVTAAGQLQVVAVFGSVPVHRGEQDLTGAQFDSPPRPCHRVPSGGLPATHHHNFEPASGTPPGVDGQHYALASESAAAFLEKLGTADCGGVYAHLVGPGPQRRLHVLGGADSSTHGEGDEHLRGGLSHHVPEGVPVLGSSGDIQIADLIGAFRRIAARQFYGVSLVGEVHEVDSFNYSTAGHIQAGNDPFPQHQKAPFPVAGHPADQERQSATKLESTRSPLAPERSGWNWTPTRCPSRTATQNRLP